MGSTSEMLELQDQPASTKSTVLEEIWFPFSVVSVVDMTKTICCCCSGIGQKLGQKKQQQKTYFSALLIKPWKRSLAFKNWLLNQNKTKTIIRWISLWLAIISLMPTNLSGALENSCPGPPNPFPADNVSGDVHLSVHKASLLQGYVVIQVCFDGGAFLGHDLGFDGSDFLHWHSLWQGSDETEEKFGSFEQSARRHELLNTTISTQGV